MFRRSGWGILGVLTCAGALALPAAAGARTKIVNAGPPTSIRTVAAKYLPKSFNKLNPDVNAFFTQRTTIHVGDTVSFHLNGFHTVDLPGKSNEDLPLILPTGKVASGFNDAAGNPFWFDGKLPLLGFNPALFARSKTHSYNGTTRVDSALASTKPFRVSFTKPGTYKFFCDVHPGMVGFITVKPKAAKIPSAKQDAARLLAQETAAVKSAKKLLKVKQPADTVSVGESTANGVELFTMFPNTLTVNKGTVVTFHMSSHSRETHTATFGPAAYLKPVAKTFQGGPFISPLATYPSDPIQPLSLSPSTHGNGFANTGVLDNDPSTKQIEPSSKIDFTTPGTYHYVCLIHPDMQGTIIVK
jgi:plastocyanin